MKILGEWIMSINEEQVLSKIARQVVKTCLQIKEDDMVTINTWHHTIKLAEQLAIECYKVGAVPLITLMTDKLWYKMMYEISAEKIAKTPLHILKSLEGETVCINIHGPEKPPTPEKIKPENMEAIRKAFKPIGKREYELKIRGADIYLGKVTPQRAEQYGLNYNEWRKTILKALATDYKEIRRKGEEIAEILEEANEVNITSNIGTNLTFKIKGRKAWIDDGIIDQKDIARGNLITTLPTGKIEIAPIENSANGTIILDNPHLILGEKIINMKWTFKNGKLVTIEADKNIEVFKKYFEKISGERDKIGRFIIGLNPEIKPQTIFDMMALGAVSIAVGYNKDIGGRNEATAHHEVTIFNATVKIDGETIIENGKIKL